MGESTDLHATRAAQLIDQLASAQGVLARVRACRAELMLEFPRSARSAISGSSWNWKAGFDPRYRPGEFAAMEIGAAAVRRCGNRSPRWRERLRRSMADRYVSVRPDLDGVSAMSALVSSVDAEAIDQVLTAVAAVAEPDDERTLQQRRADALVDLLLGRISSGCGAHWNRDSGSDWDDSGSNDPDDDPDDDDDDPDEDLARWSAVDCDGRSTHSRNSLPPTATSAPVTWATPDPPSTPPRPHRDTQRRPRLTSGICLRRRSAPIRAAAGMRAVWCHA